MAAIQRFASKSLERQALIRDLFQRVGTVLLGQQLQFLQASLIFGLGDRAGLAGSGKRRQPGLHRDRLFIGQLGGRGRLLPINGWIGSQVGCRTASGKSAREEQSQNPRNRALFSDDKHAGDDPCFSGATMTSAPHARKRHADDTLTI
ncbi:hypothetical protein PZN02_003560 [Sinorhizobium garamanticum]|uniref:Uncharacterized protein n=1 Tax=Sinorhizobium garamanticum TaxID=680247 RepID=A0ABY8DAW0_9HYPH|nr:hypothetical protein [Sinorhizobium garamanticum]WEX87192.1 hypothetical protein PZN02_003560 [Sinorhizobium garamanticum]